MVVIYVGSFPPDPETDLKNFHCKQTEYAAAWRRTGDPLVLFEALLNANGYLQFPAELNWLVEAVGGSILRDRTAQTAERLRERMRHVQRYRCVRDLRQKGLVKDDALDLAVAKLEATDAAAKRPTIGDSYDEVNRDRKQKGQDSEYSLLVARSDPTVVPVSVTRRSDGVTVINGVAQQPPRGNSQPNGHKG